MTKWLQDSKHRKHLYMVSLAAIPLLVFYGLVSQDAAPLWIALIGAVVAPTVALKNITPNVDDQATAVEDFDEQAL
jgi:hypothetical protein